MSAAAEPSGGAEVGSERAEIRALAREIAHAELAPRAPRLDEGDADARAECWGPLAATGLDRALLDAETGGAGVGAAAMLGAIEELAVADAGVALSLLLHAAALLGLGAERAARVEPGERWALVAAPPGAIAPAEGRLEGRVACALGARGAGGLLLLTPAGAGAEPEAFALEAGTPGLCVEPDAAQMGLRAAPAGAVSLAGVEAAAHRAAGEAGALRSLLWAGTAAVARGIARSAYAKARGYAQERRQGGVRIVEHDAVRDMLAQMAVRLSGPGPAAFPPACALAAKIAESDAAVATARDAVQVFGGTGYAHETGVERHMRDAQYCQLFPESNWLARDALMRLV